MLAGARAAGRPARLHLKVDTGLSRNGAPAAQWADLLDAAAKAVADGEAEVVAVWSHLANADTPDHPSLDVQAAAADRGLAGRALDRGLDPIRHLANSGGHDDAPRPALRPGPPGHRGLRARPVRPAPPPRARCVPAMTLRARVVLVKRVPAGEGVSYGHEWTTPRETTLALVPVGYADGVPRALNRHGRMRVLLGGALRPVVGRVCMDQVVVDCGDDPVRAGDEAVLFGPGADGEPTAQDWADELGTIHYEVVTGVQFRRVARVHTGRRTGAIDRGEQPRHLGRGRRGRRRGRGRGGRAGRPPPPPRSPPTGAGWPPSSASPRSSRARSRPASRPRSPRTTASGCPARRSRPPAGRRR